MIFWKLSSIQMKILNDIVCKLNWIEIELNNWISGMHIGKEGIENSLMSMVLEKRLLKIHKSEKILFHATLLGNEFKKIMFGSIQMMTYNLWVKAL